MSNLWPRVEPLLARVEKPARYIGMERGSLRPEHRPSSTSWLLVYPDTYEIGLPNQGLQILYEILNERDDAVGRTRLRALARPRPREMRAAGRPALLGRHPPRRRRLRRLAFNLSAELVYTNVLECLDLAGVPVRAEDRRPEHPLVVAGGHCAFNPEPMADFVDAFVIGDGEEAVGEITEVRRRVEARRPHRPREGVLRELATIPGVYVPSMYEVDLRRSRSSPRSRPRYPDVPDRGRQAHRRRPRRVAVPEEPARPADRGGARPAQRRGLPRLHAWLPVLPGRDDHPPGARATGRPGAHDGAGRPAPHRLRRGRAHVAVDRRLLGDRRPRRRSRQRAAGLRQRRAVAAVVAGRRVHGRHRERDPEGAPHRAHVRARGRDVAGAPGDQQAHHRRGPLRRGRGRVLAGLAAGEALLPHRAAHRDGRGHARHRRTWRARS